MNSKSEEHQDQNCLIPSTFNKQLANQPPYHDAKFLDVHESKILSHVPQNVDRRANRSDELYGFKSDQTKYLIKLGKFLMDIQIKSL